MVILPIQFPDAPYLWSYLLLSINDLSFCYPNSSASVLHHISLEVAQGEILGLLGPNGAGKTTLVSLLVGLLKPASGAIMIGDKPAVLGRKDVALAPQEYAFYPQLSIRENLSYFAGVLGGHNNKSIEQLIDHCSLTSVASIPSGKLSGGEKRRLNLAITLLQNPKILILDEPTANVDPASRAQIIELVQKQNALGTTIIYTSHLLGEVQSFCQTMALIHKGTIALSGELNRLLSAHHPILELNYLELNNEQRQQLLTIAPEAKARGQHKFDIPIAQGAQGAIQLLERLGETKLAPDSFSFAQGSLEELFLSITESDSPRP